MSGSCAADSDFGLPAALGGATAAIAKRGIRVSRHPWWRHERPNPSARGGTGVTGQDSGAGQPLVAIPYHLLDPGPVAHYLKRALVEGAIPMTRGTLSTNLAPEARFYLATPAISFEVNYP
ncbi:MAG: hypothetical protein WAT36_08825 [Chromatiaceae bacterium]